MPRHATLDSLLRAHQLQEQFVVEAVTVARGSSIRARCAPAALPPRALARRPAPRIRVSDRRRSLPPHRESRSRPPDTLDARCCRSRSRSKSSAIDARITRRALAHRRRSRGAGKRSSSRWSWPTSSAARSTSTRSCSRATASRCCSRNPPIRGVAGIRRGPRRAIIVDGRQIQAFRWTDPATARRRTTTRRAARSSGSSEIAAQVRATRHVQFTKRRFHPIPRSTGRISAWTTARRRARRWSPWPAGGS